MDLKLYIMLIHFLFVAQLQFTLNSTQSLNSNFNYLTDRTLKLSERTFIFTN